MSIASVFLAALTGACAITGADQITLGDRQVRIRDVVELHCLPAPARASIGARTLAILPRNLHTASLQRQALADLVRRRAPALTALEGAAGTLRIVVEAPPAPARPASCYRATHALPSGAVLTTDMVAATPCAADAPRAPIRFDRDLSAARTAGSVSANTYLGPVVLAKAPAIAPGSALSLKTRRGPVAIERSVTALQAGLIGERVFVRADQDVFAVRLQSRDEAAP